MKQTDQTAWEGDLDTGYREMAEDADRELEALNLAEATIGDLSKEGSESKTTENTPSMPTSKRLGVSQEQIVTFCRHWMVAEMALFGSVLRDDFHPDSDIDVLVDFLPEAAWSLFDISRMRLELSSLLGREADLVQMVGLRNPFRRQAILSNREVIYAC
jgi:predicted nucleotidyltransferase